ncbi:uncharacterized protein [Mytilus edulis]|uniref:uncharacterized protein n=1 Tax=Mytilus edulis TaxID=6550 RepID=UPI0039EF5D13
METIKSIFRAAFVLPLTAGNVVAGKSNGKLMHDGRISGLTILSSSVIIVAEIMLTAVGIQQNNERALDVARPFLIVLNFCGIVSCLAVGCREKQRNRQNINSSLANATKSLRLKFLCLFCFGCVLYRIIKLAVHVKCKVYLRPNDSVGQAVLFDFASVMFHTVQLFFIYIFSKQEFRRSHFTFYGLIMLVVANFSNWIYHSAHGYDFLSNNSSSHSHSNISRCHHSKTETSFEDYPDLANPFLDPMRLEYSLLSLIFISEMWPQMRSYVFRSHDDDNDELYVNTELTPLLQSGDPQQVTAIARNIVSSARTKYSTIALGALFISPRLVLEFMETVALIKIDFGLLSIYINIAEHVLLIIVVVRSFHIMSNQCQPRNSDDSCSVGDIMLILSFLATVGYYSMHLMAHIFALVPSYRIILTIKGLIRLIAYYFQTVYILQMKKYRIVSANGQTSVRFMCLFLSLVHLGFWFSDTFFVAQFLYKNSLYNTVLYANIQKVRQFWFPFVIFFKFECFISLYGLYKSG